MPSHPNPPSATSSGSGGPSSAPAALALHPERDGLQAELRLSLIAAVLGHMPARGVDYCEAVGLAHRIACGLDADILIEQWTRVQANEPDSYARCVTSTINASGALDLHPERDGLQAERRLELIAALLGPMTAVEVDYCEAVGLAHRIARGLPAHALIEQWARMMNAEPAFYVQHVAELIEHM